MKKHFVLALFSLLTISSIFGQAENYRFVRFDFGFGYIAPASSRFSNGFGFSPELKFQLTDKHTIGGKMEVFVMVGNDGYIIQGSQLSSQGELKTGAIVGFSVLNEYFLTDSKVRPFVGAGLGFFAGGSAGETASVNVVGGSISAQASAFVGMGVSPTIGVHFGVLKVSASYNYIFNSTDVNVEEEITSNSIVTETISTVQTESNNFVVVKLMLGIGGGRKNK